MAKKIYKFYSDAGHGWLAVKRVELVELGIIDKISSYSYQRGATVYLEEDSDLSTFCRVKGWGPEEFASNIEEKYSERSPIRSYDRFVK